MKNVLVLGAGLVSRPLVNYLLAQENVSITMASRTVSKAERILNNHPKGKAYPLNIKSPEGLDDLIKSSEVVISLLPYTYHVDVAKRCIEFKKHLVTTSYVSPEMRALDGQAKDAGVILLNELGVDPGIDHMSAMKVIETVKNEGGRIVEFKSYCGGLPAPDDDDNPLGYKFSWSPRGVILAGRNSAKFIENGSERFVPNDKLFATHWPVYAPGVGELDAYLNRDSTGYVELYGLEGIRTMLRGTLRNFGWCPTWQKLVELKYLSLDPRTDLAGKTLAQLTSELVDSNDGETLRQTVARTLSLHHDSRELRNMAWIGLFDEIPVDEKAECFVDALSARLEERMPYKPREKDMIVLLHDFLAEYPGQQEPRSIKASIVAYGEPDGDSAMSRTVSLPAAVATKLLVDGSIDLSGVYIPTIAKLYDPILAELENLGITVTEDWGS